MTFRCSGLRGVRAEVCHTPVLARLLTGALALVGLGTVAAAEEAVRWQRAEGVTVSGSILGRAPGAATSGATSAQFVSSGEGYVRFVVGEANVARAIGLATSPRNTLASVTFGLHLGSDGGYSIVENGTALPQLGAFAAGDEFRVGIEGAAVVYRHNSIVVYTSALPPVYPLFAQAVLLEAGTITAAAMEGNLAELVEWTNVGADVAAALGSVLREPMTPATDQGAVSTRGISASGGYVEFRLHSPASVVLAGLSVGDTDGGFTDIDYAFRVWSTSLTILENGVSRGSFGTAGFGDVLRVGVENGLVVYRKNGAMVYSSGVPPQFPLVVDTAIRGGVAAVTSVSLSGALVDVASPAVTMSPGGGAFGTPQAVTLSAALNAPIYYTLDGTEPTASSPFVPSGGTVNVAASARLRARTFEAGTWPSASRSEFYAIASSPSSEIVEWTDVGPNLGSGAGSVTREPGAGSPSVYEGASSTRAINSIDGYVEFKTSGYTYVGLSHGDRDGTSADVDFAINFWSSGFYITENGANRGYFTSAVGDTLRVAAEGRAIVYRRNGIAVYTSAIAPRFPLLVDTSFHPGGGSVGAVTLSGHLVDVAVAPVEFSPGGGPYPSAQTVVLSTATPGAAIHYTLDGSDPGGVSPSVSSGASVEVGATGWLKARAFAAPQRASSVRAGFYAIGTTASTEVVEWTNEGPNLLTAPGYLLRPANVGSPTVYEGAASSRAIHSSDGYLEFKAQGLGHIGLSYGDANGSSADVDFAILAWQSGFYITENGASRGHFGSLSVSDVFRVAVENGVVVYRKNGALIYTSAIRPRFPLLADVSLHPGGGSVLSATISGHLVSAAVSPVDASPAGGVFAAPQLVTLTTPTPGAAIHYSLDGTVPTPSHPSLLSGATVEIGASGWLTTRAFLPGHWPSPVRTMFYAIGPGAVSSEAVTWTNMVNASSSGPGVLSYAGSIDGLASGAVSTRAIAGGDGFVEARWFNLGSNRHVGLSRNDPNQAIATVDYAATLAASGVLIYERGQHRGTFGGSSTPGDVVRIAVEGGVVTYRKNGVLLYTSWIPPQYPLLVDTNLYYRGTGFTGVTLSGALVDVGAGPVTATPSGGHFPTAQSVALSSATPGSLIYFTLDGSEPSTASTLYTGPIEIATSAWLKARAFKDGLFGGPTLTTFYGINEAVSTELVTWTNLVNASSSGPGFVSYVGATNQLQSGATSTRAIVGGDGYVEGRWSGTGLHAQLALGIGDPSQALAGMDYSATLDAAGVSIYEQGQLRGTFGGANTPADVVRISVEGGVVKYRKNGVAIYTSPTPPRYPLLVDTKLLIRATGLTDVTLSGSLIDVAAAPVSASPGAGSYATPQVVELSTATAGASIHFTLDGTEPTAASPLYTEPVLIDATSWLKARAIRSNLTDGPTFQAFYAVATPPSTELVTWTNLFNASSAGPGVLTHSGPVNIHVSGAASTRAILGGDGYVEARWSPFAGGLLLGLSNGDADQSINGIDFTAYLTASGVIIREQGQTRGTFGGASSAADVVRVAVEGGVVKYFKNGVLLYTSWIAPRYPLLVDTALFYQNSGFSDVTLSGVLVDSRTPPPTFNPPAGAYGSALNVAIESPLGSVIRYTTNGSDPTSSSPVYSTPISIALNTPTTVKAIATAPGYLQSDIGSASYTFAASAVAPTFTPAAGPYLGPLLVTATSTTPGATIHYTFNGGDPSPSNPSVASGGTIPIPVSGVLKGISVAPALAASAVTTATYELVATEPVISPNGGSFSAPVEVTLTAGAGATIHYTLDGITPDETKTEYTGPFTVGATATMKARAFVSGWTPSGTSEATFTFGPQVGAPQFSPAAGTYASAQDIAITTSTPGSTIYFTTDGSSPTTASTVYVSPIEIASTTTIRAFVTAPGFMDSDVSNAPYDVVPFNQRVWVADNKVVLLNPSGEAWAWGSQDAGELGIDGGWVPRPVRVPTFDQARDLSSYEQSIVWIDAAGNVQGMGKNDLGQATGVPGAILTTPTPVSGLPAIRQVRTLLGGSLALAVDGTVWAWGDNSGGQGGLGHFDPSPSAHLIPGLSDIVDIQIGYLGSSALRRDGVVFVWGDWDSAVPTQVTQLPPIQSLNHAHAPSSGVDEQGNAWMWGHNGLTNTKDPFQIPSSIFCSNGVASLTGHFSGVKELRGNFVTFLDGSIRYLFDTHCLADEGELQTTLAIPPTAGSVVAASSFSSATYVMVTDLGEVWTWGWINLGGLSTESSTDPKVIAEGSYLFQTRRPYFDPGPLSGPFAGPIDITLSSGYAEWAGVEIRYTTDGTDPDGDSPLYASAFVQQGTPLTIKARSFLPGVAPSEIATGVFTFVPGELAPPTISPEGGSFSEPVEVTLQAPLGVTIRYTLDGSVPDENSAANTAPFTLTTTATVRARAFVDGWTPSEAASATFDFNRFNRRLWVNSTSTVLLDKLGRAWAWGNNDNGELGFLPTPTLVPTRATLFDRAKDLSSTGHTVWIDENDATWAMGADHSGQATGTPGSHPVSASIVPNIPQMMQVRAGEGYSAGLAADGTVWVWGANSSGQHGLGHSDPAPAPTQVPGLANVVQIQGLPYGIAALRTDGTVLFWGTGDTGQFPEPTNFLSGMKALNKGFGPPSALDAAGQVWTWGYDTVTQSVIAGPYALPATVECSSGVGTHGPPIVGVVEIRGYVLKFEDDSTRYLFDYPCGEGDGLRSRTKEMPPAAAPLAVAGSFLGESYVAVTEDGSVWTWGNSQLGDGTGGARPNDPQPIASGAYLWRTAKPVMNPKGRPIDRPTSVQILCPAIDDVFILYTTDKSEPTLASPTLACGESIEIVPNTTLIAVTARGASLSDPTTETYSRAGSVAAGPNHYLLLTEDGHVYGWGDNSTGMIGDGTAIGRSAPILSQFDQARSVAAGVAHSLGVRTDGTVWAWGGNGSGQLGDGTVATRLSPVLVSGLSSIATVAGGEAHSLALSLDGTVWAWGDNAFGQLGDGTWQDRLTPIQVSGLTGITAIAAGRNHSMAVDGNGTVWVWGRNNHGQVGDGTLVNRKLPVAITPFESPGAAVLSAGDDLSLALGPNGQLRGWGKGWDKVPADAGVVSPDWGEGCGSTPLLGVGAFDAGLNHTVARTAVSSVPTAGVYSWIGPNVEWNCGVPPPVLADGDDQVLELAAAGVRNIALTASGVVWTWETGTASDVPTRVVGPGGEHRTLAPVFDVGSGTYHQEQTVTVTAPNAGAVVHFTLDGTEPDETSSQMLSGGTVQIAQSAELKAIAVVPGLAASDVRSATYVLTPLIQIEGPAGKYHEDFDVHISTASPGVSLTYSVGANAYTPGETLPLPASGVVTLTPPSYLNVTATREGWETAYASRFVDLGVATPVITPPGGSFNAPVEASATSATPGALLRYQIGSATAGWTPWAIVESGQSILVPQTATLAVQAFRDDLPPSEVALAAFNLGVAVPTIVVERQGGPDSPAYIYGSSSTVGAAVRCTVDGSDPTFQSTLCDRGVPLSKTSTVKARAYLAGSSPSEIAERVIAVTPGSVEAPAISLPSGRYPSQRYTSVTAAPGAVLRYTTDGSEPSITSILVPEDGRVLIAASGQLRARAWVGSEGSLTRTAEYLLSGQLVGIQTISVLKTDGSVWSWGQDGGRITPWPAPAALAAPVQVTDSAVELAANTEFTMALKRDGTVTLWGLGLATPEVLPLTDIVDIAAAQGIGGALSSSGALYVWPLDPGVGTPPVPVLYDYSGCVRLLGSLSLVCVGADGVSRAFWLGDPGQNPEVWAVGGPATDDVQASCLSSSVSAYCYPQVHLGNYGARSGRIPGLFHDATDLAKNTLLTPLGEVRDLSNFGPYVFAGSSAAPVLPSLTHSVGVGRSGAIRADGSVWRWGSNFFGELANPTGVGQDPPLPATDPQGAVEVEAARAFSDAWAAQDDDEDGLLNLQEVLLGSNPRAADTNADGVTDGVAVVIGRDLLSRDLDGDGLSNAEETALGTDMMNPDTDGDGVIDRLDAFPLDPDRWEPGPANPTDTVPPVITLRTPVGAVLISTNPGGVE